MRSVCTPDTRQTAIQKIHNLKKFQCTEEGKWSIALIPRKEPTSNCQVPTQEPDSVGSYTVNISIRENGLIDCYSNHRSDLTF